MCRLLTETQVRREFWQTFEGTHEYVEGRSHNEYNATIRSEFNEFVDYLFRNGDIDDELADSVTLG